jgi:N-acetylglucosaminyl-diphospho-decaprenol L-rhamnosyltransferase
VSKYMTMSDITFVTVTHNSAEALARFWAPVSTDIDKWIVVDNASKDESAQFAQSLGAKVVSSENVGFARANNTGLAGVETPYVAFVNPDVRIDTATVGELCQRATETGGLIAPRLINPDGTNQPNGRGLPFLADKFAHRGVSMPGARLQEYVPELTGDLFPVAWVMGAAVVASTDVFRDLGGWNERYFLYYEDHELGLRAWRRGHSVHVDPNVQWIHGWARETTTKAFEPWRREVASAIRFYTSYPELVIPLRGIAARRHAHLANRVGDQG